MLQQSDNNLIVSHLKYNLAEKYVCSLASSPPDMLSAEEHRYVLF